MPNRPHGIADVLLGDPAAAGDALDRLGEASRQLIEHSEALGKVGRSVWAGKPSMRARAPTAGRRPSPAVRLPSASLTLGFAVPPI